MNYNLLDTFGIIENKDMVFSRLRTYKNLKSYSDKQLCFMINDKARVAHYFDKNFVEVASEDRAQYMWVTSGLCNDSKETLYFHFSRRGNEWGGALVGTQTSILETQSKSIGHINVIWLDIEKNQYFDLKNSQEIEVRNNGIITKGNSTMPKFVFSLLSFNPNDNKKYKWKVRISVKSNIVFIGMCNKAKVIENNYIVSGIGEFKSGLYGVSTNCILWNSSNKKENLKSISNMKEDIKEATIALEYQPQLKTLNIMFLEINFKVSINKIEEENILSPCFFYYTDGNEIDFIE